MKRRVRYVLCVGTVLAIGSLLAACGDSEDSTDSSSNKKVAIVAAVQNPTQVTEMCAAKEVLADAGFDATIQYPAEYDPSVQIPLLNAATNTNPAGILISAADPKALQPPVTQAVNKGIEVVTVDTGLEDPAAAGVASSVATNDVASGEGAAEMIGEATEGKEGEVALLSFSPGAASVTDDRSQGFEAAIAQYDNLDYLGVTVADSLTEAAAKTNALLASHPNLVGIAADWGEASAGMIQALRQRGVTAEDMVSVANDAEAVQIDAIRKGHLYGSVFPKILANGIEAGEQLVKALEGESTTATISSTPLSVTKANVEDPGASKYFIDESSTC